jgi:hypothetical protein
MITSVVTKHLLQILSTEHWCLLGDAAPFLRFGVKIQPCDLIFTLTRWGRESIYYHLLLQINTSKQHKRIENCTAVKSY